MIILEHLRCPLHRDTFAIKPVRQWVERCCEGRVLNLFASPTLLDVNEVRNDLDQTMPAEYHLDALELLRDWPGDRFDTILLDPPYALRKSMELYNGKICSSFRQLKDEIPRCLSPGGIVITLAIILLKWALAGNFH